MSGLGDAVGRALRSAEDRSVPAYLRAESGAQEAAPSDWRTELAALQRDAGGVSQLARKLGVHRTTVQRWNNAKISAPRPSMLDKIGNDFRAVTMPTINPADIRLTTTETGGRRRTLTGNQLRLSDAAVENMRHAWIETGDQEKAAAALWKGIGDDTYKSLLADDEFEDEDEEFETVIGKKYRFTVGGFFI